MANTTGFRGLGVTITPIRHASETPEQFQARVAADPAAAAAVAQARTKAAADEVVRQTYLAAQQAAANQTSGGASGGMILFGALGLVAAAAVAIVMTRKKKGIPQALANRISAHTRKMYKDYFKGERKAVKRKWKKAIKRARKSNEIGMLGWPAGKKCRKPCRCVCPPGGGGGGGGGGWGSRSSGRARARRRARRAGWGRRRAYR